TVEAGSPAEYRIVDKDEYTAGVDDIALDETASNDVYNMHGVLILRDATDAQIDALPRGIYIIGGRKVMK
ncbi:MAG: hypothetical protein K2F94_01430, partial [Muribaculaceae bacterium]|nr:hypothetical protein [Muribaculaceae bacterium]